MLSTLQGRAGWCPAWRSEEKFCSRSEAWRAPIIASQALGSEAKWRTYQKRKENLRHLLGKRIYQCCFAAMELVVGTAGTGLNVHAIGHTV